MRYEVFKLDDDHWRARAVDADGFCYVADFFGQMAEVRAREYAAFKNGEVFVAMSPAR